MTKNPDVLIYEANICLEQLFYRCFHVNKKNPKFSFMKLTFVMKVLLNEVEKITKISSSNFSCIFPNPNNVFQFEFELL